MFLKIVTKDQVKKMKFKPELFQLPNLKKVVEDITGLPESSFKLVFRDVENYEIPLRDVYDMEYFVDNAFNQKFAVVHVRDAQGGDDSHDFIDVTMVKQAEQPVAPQEVVVEKVEEPVQQSETQLIVEETEERADSIKMEQEVETPIEQAIETNPTTELKEETESPMEPETEKVISQIIQNDVEKNATEEFLFKCQDFLKALFVPPSQSQSQVQSQVQSQTQSETPRETKHLEDRLNVLESQMALLTQALQKKKEKKERKEQKKEEIKEKKLRKLNKKVKPESNELEVNTIHRSVTCDGCGLSPITGKRFKCLMCHDFDLCSKCEAKNDHAHPMVRCIEQDNSFLLNKLQRKYSKYSRRNHSGSGVFFENIHSRITGLAKMVGGRGCRRRQCETTPAEEPVVKVRAEEQPDLETKIVEENVFNTKIEEEPITQPEPQEQPKVSEPTPNSDESVQEKRQLLEFMFGSDDSAAIDELIRRFSNLQLDKFVEVIAQEYKNSFY